MMTGDFSSLAFPFSSLIINDAFNGDVFAVNPR
jgi:hypothetical protein